MITPPTISDYSLTKQFGSNTIKIHLVLSRAIRIDGSRFVVAISGLVAGTDFFVSFWQD